MGCSPLPPLSVYRFAVIAVLLPHHEDLEHLIRRPACAPRAESAFPTGQGWVVTTFLLLNSAN